jgi:zinc/manganese transport system permease protein
VNPELDILWPAFVVGVLVTATHAPLGIQVLERGIVFIDLAVAQIAGLGVILADSLGFEPRGVAVQAVIGASFIVAANLAILLLAANPHGAEHLKDLLAGQLLWVNPAQLPLLGVLSAALVAVWFGARARAGRTGFYLLFACAVTISVQLVGVYLVFATLIVPALATHRFARRRLAACYAVGVAGYALGLAASAVYDLPAGPLVVCALSALGAALFALGPRLKLPPPAAT